MSTDPSDTDDDTDHAGPGAARRQLVRVTARVAATLLAIAVLTGTGVTWTIKSRADLTMQARTIRAVQTDDPNIVAPTIATTSTESAPVTEQVVTYTPENILLLGSDSHKRRSADTNAPPGQSDTLMIAHLSADRRRIEVLSVPRDVQIPAPTCKQWNNGVVSTIDQPVSPDEVWKITNAYAVGGPACTVRAVQQLTGIRIDRVVVIDLNGFRAMVDAFGGITVDFCQPIIDQELATVIATPGPQLLNGDSALNVVRARKVDGDASGDLGRIRRQQIVLSAMVDQVTSAGTLINPVRLDAVLQALLSNTYTDNVSIDDLIGLAQSLRGASSADVSFFTVPTSISRTNSDALALNETRARAIFDALINDEPIPSQGSTVAPTAGSSSRDAPIAPVLPTAGANHEAPPPVNAGDDLCA